MAAAVQSMPRVLRGGGEEYKIAIRLSVMTADQIENVNYAVDSRYPPRAPQTVDMIVVTRPTAPCILQLISDVTAAVFTVGAVAYTTAYLPVRVTTEMGGDISGAVVDVIMTFNGISSGGLIVDATH